MLQSVGAGFTNNFINFVKYFQIFNENTKYEIKKKWNAKTNDFDNFVSVHVLL